MNYGLIVKRAFDILAALVGLIILLPLFLVVAILVKIDSPGKIFFMQERILRKYDRNTR